ncbi:hypothetical protein PV726_19355 [Streptomyces europaeiscabiei]|uniref:hypothetical protein n=1 Tax=Streptomyces europaeiscabiei TaxID=146819 RepID=UPI0029A0CC22|nr:hypothetical protein [Streptomyces europaeiscabiei]MDX3692463.1 hypothetical protein [Streptomyces europaeiscabiei]
MTGPCRPTGLRPEDRAGFEAVLGQALDAPDIRDVLRADPSGVAVRRLRVRASADAGHDRGGGAGRVPRVSHRTHVRRRGRAEGRGGGRGRGRADR